MDIVLKYKGGRKHLSILMCLFLILFLTGCKADTSNPKNDLGLIEEEVTDEKEVSDVPLDDADISDDVDASDEIKNTDNIDNPNSADNTEDTDNIDNQNNNHNTEDPEIEDFSVLDKYFKDYTFDVLYDENLEFYERTYTIHGSYDLNGDGEEEQISALLKQGAEESYIEVNGIKVSIYTMSPTGEVQIIDLDNRDEYVELAIFDDGPSGDPEFKFFRYDGKELISLGSIERGGLMDGQGKLISWFNLSNNFEPHFFSAWGVFSDGKFVTTNHDVEQYIGKSYKISGSGFFVPLDNYSGNFIDYVDWNFESLREFENTEIKLLDIDISPEDRTLNWYYVELPEGERGLLYFWIGD